ncbi:MAG: hypothetical protein HYS13_20215 [Planctomycetia bacterium]|nr:hypothetical protein [Planctomycetia bacterium]
MPDLAVYLRRLCPDVVCVPSLSQLLPAEVLNIPRFGFLNLHPSLLPKYHGPFPWFWQYYHYEQFFGVTVHRIDEGQDTGPILKQAPFFVERGTEVGEAERRGADVAANLLCEALNELESGTARLRPQPRHDFPKARIVRRDEPLVQWDEWDLQRVWHFLRGTQPWLDAVAYPPGGPWRIGPYELGACGEQSGTVGRDDQGNFIAHRQGKIRLWRRQAG